MKKIAILAAFVGIILTGCLKDSPNVDFTTIKPTVHFFNSGLSYFSSDAVTFPSDTVTIPMIINLASVNTLDKDLTVTIGVDQDAYTTYNATSGIQYQFMADSSFSLPVTTATIPAGKRTDTLYVSFYGHTFDPTISYMLPISITDANGTDLSANFDTHYYHVIGNPLAGTYIWDFYRWNAVADTTGPPNSTVDEGEIIGVPPVDPTTVFVPEGYLNANGLGNGGINIGFTNTNGVLSDPVATIDDFTQKAIDDAGFKVVTGPSIVAYQIVGDASTKYAGTYFRVYFEILNSSGADRKTINVYTKQ